MQFRRGEFAWRLDCANGGTFPGTQGRDAGRQTRPGCMHMREIGDGNVVSLLGELSNYSQLVC